jgi:arylsulfatase A-like enzyme
VPTGGGGFEHFYGFIGAETNQWAPAPYRDTVPIEPDRTAEEGYHFTEDLTDKAIEWVNQQKALMPDKPFFIYLAPGAAHAPTTFRRHGRRSTTATSTTAGTRSASARSRARRSSG